MGAERTKILLPFQGVGREYAELKNSIFPDNAPQKDFWEQSGQKSFCRLWVLSGNMRNFK